MVGSADNLETRLKPLVSELGNRMPPGFLTIGIVVSLFAAAACEEQESVVGYDAPKDAPAPDTAFVSPPQPAMPVQSAETVHWKLPPGWVHQTGSRPMRFATLEASTDHSRLEVSISMLSGDGGGLLANINRWRTQQMGLQPIGKGDVAEHAARLKVKESEAYLVNIESNQNEQNRRMLVAIIFRPGGTWFFKAVAGSEVVAEHRPGFMELLTSVHFVAAPQAAPPPSATTDVAAAAASWKVPPGWQQDADPGPMRQASFQIGAGAEAASVTVTRFPGDVGGLTANINRWRSQLGLEPVERSSDQAMTALKIAGIDGRMIDIGDQGGSGKRLLVAMVPHGGLTWFFKMTGSGNVVQKHWPQFDAFLESIVFDQDG